MELNACPGGCVGGVMAVENPYIARVRLQTIRRYMPVMMNYLQDDPKTPIPDVMLGTKPGEYSSADQLHHDRAMSFKMMFEIEKIAKQLPGMDCGSCGAPTCRAHAEDIVKGESTLDNCVIRMREILQKQKEQDGELK